VTFDEFNNVVVTAAELFEQAIAKGPEGEAEFYALWDKLVARALHGRPGVPAAAIISYAAGLAQGRLEGRGQLLPEIGPAPGRVH